jgi:hypothetical protein
VSTPVPLARLAEIIDRSQAAGRIEALLPVGVRPRQLLVRTLLIGMLLTLAGHRPAHLTRVHQALTSLPETDRIRLGVVADWTHGPHLLTYRQVERTFGLVVNALGKEHPDGAPSPDLAAILGALLEASIPAGHKDTTRALAADWSDLETFSRPPPAKGGDCAGPEASWGHRRGDSPGQKDELFYGFYLSASTMVKEENGPPVPELARRMTLTSCRLDPAEAMVPVLQRMPADGIPLGDILDDSGYAHRVPGNWAVPLRAAGAQLIQDLHPHDRGPKGTHAGAVIANGNLYCPATPRPLLELGPLARDATGEQTAAHDHQSAETAVWRTASSARSPLTTRTATTGSCAPPSWANSAARSGPSHCPWTTSGPRSSPRPSTPRRAAPSRPSPCRRRCTPRPRRNTTTPPRRTAGPTPGAPPPSGPSPPSRTLPATTSAAAGAGSWD